MRVLEGGWPASATIQRTFPGHYYTSREIFDEEIEKIWFKSWLCAGRTEQIPAIGDFFTVQIADESIIIIRNRHGGVSAFYNTCRHRGSRLCTTDTGNCRNSLIRCPYHGWTYDASEGKLVAIHIPESAGLDKSKFPLFAVRVETWEGFIWINFDSNAPALSESLGLPASYAYYDRYHVGKLKVGKQISYTVKANWKIVSENALECLHCTHIHPQFDKTYTLNSPRHWLHETLPETKVFKHSGGVEIAPGFLTLSMDGKPRRPHFSDLTEKDTRHGYFGAIYPSMHFGFAPDYVFVLVIWPVDVSTSALRAFWLFAPEVMADESFDPTDAVEFWDLTNVQDWRACELAQQGSSSRAFRDGGVLVQHEWRVGLFRQYVLEALNQ